MLSAAKQDPLHSSVDGPFIIRTETIVPKSNDAETKDLLATWEARMARYERELAPVSDPHQKLYRLMRVLNWDFTHHYAGAHHDLGDFLQQGKGNCVAQTKLIIAAIQRMGIRLPSNEGIGIQVFGDHLQPVFYRRDEQGRISSVQNLVNGETKDRVVAPIYAPGLLAVGFLQWADASSPVSMEELLIATPAKADIQRAPARGTGLDQKETPLAMELPESEAITGLDAPADAELGAPDFGAAAIDADAKGLSKGAADAMSGNGQKRDAYLFSDFPAISQDDLVHDFYATPLYLVFRTASMRDHYLNLSSNEDRAAFLETIAYNELRRTEQSPGFQKMIDFMADPFHVLPTLSPEEMKAIGAIYKIFSAGLATLCENISFGGIAADDDVIRTRLQSRLPRWQEFSESKTNFGRTIFDHPRELLTFLNQLPNSEKRNGVLEFLKNIGVRNPIPPEYRYPLIPFIHLIADPSQVGMNARKGAWTEYVPPPRPVRSEELIWVEVEGSPHAAVSPAAPLSPEANERGARGNKGQNARIVVSPETLLDLALFFRDKQLAERWDDSLTQALFRGKGPTRDQAFKVLHLWEDCYEVRRPYSSIRPYRGDTSLSKASLAEAPPSLGRALTMLKERMPDIVNTRFGTPL